MASEKRPEIPVCTPLGSNRFRCAHPCAYPSVIPEFCASKLSWTHHERLGPGLRPWIPAFATMTEWAATRGKSENESVAPAPSAPPSLLLAHFFRSPAKAGVHGSPLSLGAEGPCFRREAGKATMTEWAATRGKSDNESVAPAPTPAQAAPATKRCPTSSRPSSGLGCRTGPPRRPPADARPWCGRG